MKKILAFIFPLIIAMNAEATRAGQPIEVAFVIDMSGSSNGLLNDVRNSFYTVINEISSLQPAPQLKIALVLYGRPSFGRDFNYVKVVSDFTTDYDQIMFELVKLKPFVEKGDQFVGSAINAANRNLNWSSNAEVPKLMFLIGNGMVNTSMYDFKKATEESFEKGIQVMPVYAFVYSKVLREIPGWQVIANVAGTTYNEIQINKPLRWVTICQDNDALIQFNKKHNSSFVPFAVHSSELEDRNRSIDEYCHHAGPSVLEARTYFKCSDAYRKEVARWDLVENTYKDFLNIALIDRTYMDGSLGDMDEYAFKSYVYNMRIERSRVQSEMFYLTGGNNRQYQINSKRALQFISNSTTFQQVTIDAIMKIALQRGYALPPFASN